MAKLKHYTYGDVIRAAQAHMITCRLQGQTPFSLESLQCPFRVRRDRKSILSALVKYLPGLGVMNLTKVVSEVYQLRARRKELRCDRPKPGARLFPLDEARYNAFALRVWFKRGADTFGLPNVRGCVWGEGRIQEGTYKYNWGSNRFKVDNRVLGCALTTDENGKPCLTITRPVNMRD